MSVTPTSPLPVVPAVPAAPDAGVGPNPAAAGFAALVAALVGGAGTSASGPTLAGAAGAAGTAEAVDPGSTSAGESEPDDAEPASVETAEVTTALGGQLPTALGTATPVPAAASAQAAGAPTTGAVTGIPGAAGTIDPLATDALGGRPAGVVEQPAPTPARDGVPLQPGTSAAAPDATSTETSPAVAAPARQAGSNQPLPDATTPANPAGPTSAAPATSAAPTTAAPSGSAPDQAAPAPAVTRQVLPEVARLVSRGDGTHRLTMTLQPEILGEVRVTLTVRQGEVQVRLAAGEEARAALLEGAPELRRVLELAGATETRVLVRDLGGPALAGQPSPAAGDQTRGDTGATGHGRQDPDHHDAGTRRGTTARDGSSDGTHASRPEPVNRTRSAGVDLTM